MDGYAFSSCDLARLAQASSLTVEPEEAVAPSEERIRKNIIQVQLSLCLHDSTVLAALLSAVWRPLS
jgi:hypothetical protein